MTNRVEQNCHSALSATSIGGISTKRLKALSAIIFACVFSHTSQVSADDRGYHCPLKSTQVVPSSTPALVSGTGYVTLAIASFNVRPESGWWGYHWPYFALGVKPPNASAPASTNAFNSAAVFGLDDLQKDAFVIELKGHPNAAGIKTISNLDIQSLPYPIKNAGQFKLAVFVSALDDPNDECKFLQLTKSLNAVNSQTGAINPYSALSGTAINAVQMAFQDITTFLGTGQDQYLIGSEDGYEVYGPAQTGDDKLAPRLMTGGLLYYDEELHDNLKHRLGDIDNSKWEVRPDFSLCYNQPYKGHAKYTVQPDDGAYAIINIKYTSTLLKPAGTSIDSAGDVFNCELPNGMYSTTASDHSSKRFIANDSLSQLTSISALGGNLHADDVLNRFTNARDICNKIRGEVNDCALLNDNDKKTLLRYYEQQIFTAYLKAFKDEAAFNTVVSSNIKDNLTDLIYLNSYMVENSTYPASKLFLKDIFSTHEMKEDLDFASVVSNCWEKVLL